MLVLTLSRTHFVRVYAHGSDGSPIEMDIELKHASGGKAKLAFNGPHEFRVLRGKAIARGEQHDSENPTD